MTATENAIRDLRLLVVGGAGFVGSNLVRRALDGGAAEVVVVDNLLSAERENLPDDARVELRLGSIADDEILAGLDGGFDWVFHLATFHGNQSSIARPLDDHANNLITTLKLFERLTELDVQRVVYASTGCALAEKDVTEATPVVEGDVVPLDFDSPYQISKIVGEMYALYYHRRTGLPVVRARFQNVYGPREVLGAGAWRGTEHTIWRNVVPTFVWRALNGMPLQVHGGGAASRDFIFVEDIAEGLLRCAATPGVEGEVFNLASGVETSIRELAETIVELAGTGAEVEDAGARDWDRSLARVGDPSKARTQLGFEARVGLREGLERTVAWTRENADFIGRCIRRHEARAVAASA